MNNSILCKQHSFSLNLENPSRNKVRGKSYSAGHIRELLSHRYLSVARVYVLALTRAEVACPHDWTIIRLATRKCDGQLDDLIIVLVTKFRFQLVSIFP